MSFSLLTAHTIKLNSRPSMTEPIAQNILDNHVNGNHSEVAELVQNINALQLVRVTRWLLSEEGGNMEPEKALRMLELALKKSL